MTDKERIEILEKQVRDLQARIGELTTYVDKLMNESEPRRASIQDAVDDLQNSVEIIFKNASMVGDVQFRSGVTHKIV